MTKIRSIMLLLAALAISVAMPLRAYAEDITISNAVELRSFRDEVNAGNDFAEKTIILAADIDLAGEDWVPIGTDETPFAGKFNGGNHTISGLRITTEVMRDLTVSDMRGKGGGLFLNVEGENAQIANLTVKGSIDGAPSGNVLAAGGIAARLGPGAVIYRCLNKATVTLGSTGTELGPYAYAGGVAGYSEGHVIYCVNEGTVTGARQGRLCNGRRYSRLAARRRNFILRQRRARSGAGGRERPPLLRGRHSRKRRELIRFLRQKPAGRLLIHARGRNHGIRDGFRSARRGQHRACKLRGAGWKRRDGRRHNGPALQRLRRRKLLQHRQSPNKRLVILLLRRRHSGMEQRGLLLVEQDIQLH